MLYTIESGNWPPEELCPCVARATTALMTRFKAIGLQPDRTSTMRADGTAHALGRAVDFTLRELWPANDSDESPEFHLRPDLTAFLKTALCAYARSEPHAANGLWVIIEHDHIHVERRDPNGFAYLAKYIPCKDAQLVRQCTNPAKVQTITRYKVKEPHHVQSISS